MKMTSDKFFDEMLKDNTPAPTVDQSEKLADILDQRLNQAMDKYIDKLSKLNEKETNYEQEGNGAGSNSGDGEGNEDIDTDGDDSIS